MERTVIEYPAIIYKSSNNKYIANCITKRIVCYGKSEQTALKNLENLLNGVCTDYQIKIKPIFGLNLKHANH